MTLRIRNWRDFQHYKTRRPPWIKLHKTLLDNYEFIRLPLASQVLAPRLWLVASESEDGSLPSDPAKLSFRTHWPEDELESALRPLIEAGFVEEMRGASVVLAERKQNHLPETEEETEGEERREEPALPPADRAERAIRLSTEALRTKLYALIDESVRLDPKHRDPTELIRLFTSYQKPDGTWVKGVVNASLLSHERLERSIKDAEEQIEDWNGEREERRQQPGHLKVHRLQGGVG